MPHSKDESSDEEWVERDDSGEPEDRQDISNSCESEKVVEAFDKSLTDAKEKKREKDVRSAETSASRSNDERKDRNEVKHHSSDRYDRREDKSRRESDRSDESRSRKYDDVDRISNKRPRRDDMDGDRMERGNQDRDRDSSRRRDGYHSRGRDDRERFQRKDDRRGYGASRRGYRSGGNGNHSGGRGRNDDRERSWRGKERRNEREDRSTWDIRPSPDEVAKQKKLLWGKSSSQAVGEESGGCGDHGSGETATASSGQQKNVGLWSSAITACGVGGDQANKFLKLMGIKNAPAVNPASEDSKRLQEETEKQRKMMRDLDRQYEVARETTHMGRGLGLGFHQ
ncbi:hypothetical protein KIN20_033851 [Parelaphostrongylus tenuis]|uniref:Small acidic protein-like domain-containing protein n=1 Tax=Parelaphostrongylus tenuis TaxID=148309 RepID=A0AAD5WJ84_PARTN|nr:hypothetical protein KIN20_033851 [Parelaphostrongylus tenuis]